MKELQEIQSKLQAPKNQRNNFGGYNYRSCEDILEAVKPLLAELHCILTLTDDILLIGERFYVKATAEIRNETGESHVTTAFAREEETKKGMDAAQITGSASSYARKYALNGLFCIDDNKDPDAGKNHPTKGSPTPAGKGKPELTPSHAKWEACVKNVKTGRFSIEALREHYEISPEVERRLTMEAQNGR